MNEQNKERILNRQHSMNSQIPRCRVCRRRLKSATAIAAGVGQTCLRKERGGAKKSVRQRTGMGVVEIDPDQLELSFGGNDLPVEPAPSNRRSA